MTEHFIRYYDCGLHVESQCRCPDPAKTKTVGSTVCPQCHPTAPTARELLERVRAAFDRGEVVAGSETLLASRVEKVLALHKADRDQKYGGITFCSHCSHLLGHGRLEPWPCPTIRILNGEEA